MTCQTRELVNNDKERLGKGDLFKIYLAIDRKLIQESQSYGKGFKGLGAAEVAQLDSIITDIMKVDITDSEVDEIANTGLEGLGNIFKKVASSVKKAVDKVGDTKVGSAVAKVVQKAAYAVKRVAAFPLRAQVTAIIKLMKGPVAKAFIYTFIPDGSPLLNEMQYPDIVRKRKNQLKALGIVQKALAFKPDYLQKQVRNVIVDHYKKTPEEILHDFSNKKETEFNWTADQLRDDGQIGVDPVEIVLASATFVSAVAGLSQVFKKPNLPSTSDWPVGSEIPDGKNVTNDPFYKKKSFWSSTGGIATITGGVLVVGGGLYYAFSD